MGSPRVPFVLAPDAPSKPARPKGGPLVPNTKCNIHLVHESRLRRTMQTRASVRCSSVDSDPREDQSARLERRNHATRNPHRRLSRGAAHPPSPRYRYTDPHSDKVDG